MYLIYIYFLTNGRDKGLEVFHNYAYLILLYFTIQRSDISGFHKFDSRSELTMTCFSRQVF